MWNNWQFYSMRQKMLEKNNELFTNACLLLMIGRKIFKKIILKNWFSEKKADEYITELIRVIEEYQKTIINAAQSKAILIQPQNFTKKLDY